MILPYKHKLNPHATHITIQSQLRRLPPDLAEWYSGYLNGLKDSHENGYEHALTELTAELDQLLKDHTEHSTSDGFCSSINNNTTKPHGMGLSGFVSKRHRPKFRLWPKCLPGYR